MYNTFVAFSRNDQHVSYFLFPNNGSISVLTRADKDVNLRRCAPSSAYS